MADQEPVIKDEVEMVLVFNLFLNFIPNGICVTHDSDEHVHKMDHEDEYTKEVDKEEEVPLRRFTIRKWSCVGIWYNKVRNVVERAT